MGLTAAPMDGAAEATRPKKRKAEAVEDASSALDAALACADQHHGGVPVGSLLVDKLRVNLFQKLLKPHKLQLLGVEAQIGDNQRQLLPAQSRLLHLPPLAVLAIEAPTDSSELSSALAELVHSTGATYYPGVRRQDALFGRAPNLTPVLDPAPRFTF